MEPGSASDSAKLVVTVARGGQRRPLSALVAPFGRDGDERAAIVFLSDPDGGAETREQALERLFGLTPAEARLAASLASGHSLQASAKAAGVTHHTARTHLKHIFVKTQTKRQAELVRLLVGSPAALVRDA